MRAILIVICRCFPPTSTTSTCSSRLTEKLISRPTWAFLFTLTLVVGCLPPWSTKARKLSDSSDCRNVVIFLPVRTCITWKWGCNFYGIAGKNDFYDIGGWVKVFSEKKWGRGRKTILRIGNLFQAYLFLGKDDPRF